MSDTRYSNLGTYHCYNTVDGTIADSKVLISNHDFMLINHRKIQDASNYENELGFVPHNFACFHVDSGKFQN